MRNPSIFDCLIVLCVLTASASSVPVTDTQSSVVHVEDERSVIGENGNDTFIATAPVESGYKAKETQSNINTTHPREQQNLVGTMGAVAAETNEDNMASASNYDAAAVYASLITPETFQQYVNQFGAAYAPYLASPPAVPAAVYPYPGPYVVQTGYEGYLMPSATTAPTSTTTATTGSATTTTTSTTTPSSLFSPGPVLSGLMSSLMMSTYFRIIAAVLSTIFMIVFGNVITKTICRLTPICDLSETTVTYLRGRGAEDVGRMIAKGMTPDRVRRATEFVRQAIRKYQELQSFVGDSNKWE